MAILRWDEKAGCFAACISRILASSHFYCWLSFLWHGNVATLIWLDGCVTSWPIASIQLIHWVALLRYKCICDQLSGLGFFPERGTIWTMGTKLWLDCMKIRLRLCEPRHDKTNKMSVRPAKTQIIRVFAVRKKKAWVLSHPLSAQRRLWSDWADAQADLLVINLGGRPGWSESLLGAQSLCWFCYVVAHVPFAFPSGSPIQLIIT